MNRLSVDEDRCEGYGFCEENAADLVHLDDDGVLDVLQPDVPESRVGAAEAAVRACPVAALRLHRVPADA